MSVFSEISVLFFWFPTTMGQNLPKANVTRKLSRAIQPTSAAFLNFMCPAQAIREYWETQIVGKQSNIGFRHVVGDMVLDSGKRKAVVKWLAEFDNVRYRALVNLCCRLQSMQPLYHLASALCNTPRPSHVVLFW